MPASNRPVPMSYGQSRRLPDKDSKYWLKDIEAEDTYDQPLKQPYPVFSNLPSIRFPFRYPLLGAPGFGFLDD